MRDTKLVMESYLTYNIDQILHVLTIMLAVCLFVVAAISYKRDGRSRLLFLSGAFFIMLIKESINYLYTLQFGYVMYAYLTLFLQNYLPSCKAPLDHIINLLILSMFSLGILIKR
ncbi:MAG: hypothetical protein ACE5GD_00150 [Candidatus Geothermarchaeales archaeon]